MDDALLLPQQNELNMSSVTGNFVVTIFVLLKGQFIAVSIILNWVDSKNKRVVDLHPVFDA